MPAAEREWQPENDVWDTLLSFRLVGPDAPTQVIRLPQPLLTDPSQHLTHSLVHCRRKSSWQQEGAVAGHIASLIRKQREMDAGTRLTFSSVSDSGPQPVGRCQTAPVCEYG